MDFFTVGKKKRPVRLCEATRRFAFESLNHKYGRDTLENYSVTFDGDTEYESADDISKYDMAIKKSHLNLRYAFAREKR